MAMPAAAWSATPVTQRGGLDHSANSAPSRLPSPGSIAMSRMRPSSFTASNLHYPIRSYSLSAHDQIDNIDLT